LLDYGFWDTKEKASFVNYQMVVLVADSAVSGETYNFSAWAAFGQSLLVKEDPEIIAADIVVEVRQKVAAILN